jgi:hypothetical protein
MGSHQAEGQKTHSHEREFDMAVEPATLTVPLQVLGSCPGCTDAVVADANAVRYADDWYHLRCALERQAEQDS